MRLKPVILSAPEIQDFYHGFANEILWPLFHDLQMLCNYEPRYWQTYREVNRRFAEVICETAQAGDFLWIHDYHTPRSTSLADRRNDYADLNT